MFKPGDTGGTTSSPIDLLFRPGMMIPYAGAAAPTGWLLADGSVVSQVTYAALFAICGTTFNTGGEGAGNFRLPNPISRSVMGAGTTVGLTSVAIGEKKGEETHVLLTGELATHSHGVTDPGHNHTQNAHTHTITDGGHTHTITDPTHNHTQNAHNHAITDPGHVHSMNKASTAGGDGSGYAWSSTSGTNNTGMISATTGITVNNQTATNIAASTGITGANSNTTGISVNNQTATNNSNTTGVTTNNEGSNTGHNTIHPVLGMTYIIKY